MPKRVIDGDALWRSRKLLLVPAEYRGEYANLLPLADVNGSFECDAASVYSDVYSYNRTTITPVDVTVMLEAFEAAGMLVRWKQEGKIWGHFIGIQKPGRLPSGKHLTRHRNLPPLPPSLTTESAQDVPKESGSIPESPGVSGTVPENPPLGLGLGKGMGPGASNHVNSAEASSVVQRDAEFDGSAWALATFKAYPTWGDPDATVAPARLADAYMRTIEAEAPSRGGLRKTAEWFLEVTREFDRQSAGKEPQFIMGLEKFIRQGYAEVKVPARAGTRYIPPESDEDCEKRLREEARQRRSNLQEAAAL
jgi:hypothetical protein